MSDFLMNINPEELEAMQIYHDELAQIEYELWEASMEEAIAKGYFEI